MNKDMLISLMPKVVVEDVNNAIEEQRGIVEAGKSFVSQLSINRYLYTKLADYDIDERLNLFDELRKYDLHIYENELWFFSELDTESFAFILEENFNLDDMYKLDNFYIENILKGIDITEKEVHLWEDKYMSFSDVLGKFVFKTGGMFMGDTPPLMMMLTAKKALLGTYLAEKNVESLLNGQKEIYDITILM
jgi:hypothetical protein